MLEVTWLLYKLFESGIFCIPNIWWMTNML